MSSPRVRALIVTASLLLTAACSSTSSRSTDTEGTEGTTTSSSLVGDSTTTSAGETTTTASPETTTAPTPAPTAAPATSPPATSPPATSPPSTGPRVVSATFNGPSACPSPDVSVPLPSPTVSITWSATNADSVYVAIDNAYGPWESGLPLTGSIELPFSCPGSHTYFVVAVKGSQTDIEQKTFTAN